MTVKIYGASDDLIEIDGDVSEEFSAIMEEDEKVYLAFSDGTVLSVVYDQDGIWRINRLAEGTAKYNKSEPMGDGYSDLVTLEGQINWVVFGSQFKKKAKVV